MVEKDKVELSWLQCQIPKADWDKLNARRQALSLKWAEVVGPGTEARMVALEKAAAKKAKSEEAQK
jgi:hypothetical protein